MWTAVGPDTGGEDSAKLRWFTQISAWATSAINKIHNDNVYTEENQNNET
jgi:hypothetical protein